MIGLIVTGHGHFATGLTTSLNLIAGDAKEYVAVDFEATDSTDDLAKKLTDAMDSLKDCEGIIVLSDLAGGSPFKTAVEIGFLTRTFSEDVHALAESACNVGKDQVMRYVFQHIEQNDDFSDGI